MRSNRSFRFPVAVAFLCFVTVTGMNAEAQPPVFHGKDKETGAMISRVSRETVTPEGGIEIGIQIVHVHSNGNITIAFSSSSEAKLKTFDSSSAFIIADDKRIALKFNRYHAFVLIEGRPPFHRLWFSPLDRDAIDRIKAAKNLSIEISTVSGIPATRRLDAKAISALKEVIKGAPSE